MQALKDHKVHRVSKVSKDKSVTLDHRDHKVLKDSVACRDK